MMMIENLIISILMISCRVWEQKKAEKDYIIDYATRKNRGKFNVMSVLDEEAYGDGGGCEVSKTKEMLLAGK